VREVEASDLRIAQRFFEAGEAFFMATDSLGQKEFAGYIGHIGMKFLAGPPVPVKQLLPAFTRCSHWNPSAASDARIEEHETGLLEKAVEGSGRIG
jgi:hypothetical protein